MSKRLPRARRAHLLACARSLPRRPRPWWTAADFRTERDKLEAQLTRFNTRLTYHPNPLLH